MLFMVGRVGLISLHPHSRRQQHWSPILWLWWSVNSDLDLVIIYSFNVGRSFLNTAKEGMEEGIHPPVGDKHLKLPTCHPGNTCHTETHILTSFKFDYRQQKLGPHSLVPSVPGEESCGLGGVGSLGLGGMFDHAPLTLWGMCTRRLTPHIV